MRSLTKSTSGDIAGSAIEISSLSLLERERFARVERARVIGELVADGILWVARLPRRLAELAWFAAPKQRV
jgi:hypothetical protein